MDFPSQNDFLVPFLQLLDDGASHTRHDMMNGLVGHFALTDVQQAAKSGKHNTLINRVAWCDTHFVKAGFVQKEAYTPDSRLDKFMITALGLRELRRFADKIRVGYLQSFYLAKVIRGAGADDSTSDAERTLYEAFNRLDDNWTVIQGARWIGKDKATVGEIDFLVIHRKHGVLVMEVKGGIISVDNGDWTTTTRNGYKTAIQDPCAQAERNRRELRKWLEKLPQTKGIKFAIFPAIALPDSVVKGDIRPDCPADIFLDMRHIDDVEARLLAIFAYWRNHADAGNSVMDVGGASALVSVFQVTRGFQPQIVEIFKRERKHIEQSTETQFRILRQLSFHRRATIIGGAGTGKTLLAMEKTQQLLNMGFRVLLVCYNNPLKDWLASQIQHENLVVTNFHGLVKQAGGWAKIGVNQYSFEQFLEVAPELLLQAAESLQQTGQGYLFDAIIVDEAQDFADTWWFGINELLKDPQGGVLYVFFDDNQRIYQQIGDIPMATTPFILTDNCRNTQQIHQRMSDYIANSTLTDCLGPEGRPIEIHATKNPSEAGKQLSVVLANLIQTQGISPKDIIILTPAGKERSGWKENMQIGNYSLTWYLNDDNPHGVRVSTIHSFKGLESAVIILTEFERMRQDDLHNSLIYIGISRARNHVVVIGNLPKPSQ
jgi:hypothetical protein